MNLFLFPQRIGNFDIIAPVFLKIKRKNPKINNYILINNKKLFKELLENKEIFDLTLGGIGLTGTIVSVTFNLTEIENSKFLTKKIISKIVNKNL